MIWALVACSIVAYLGVGMVVAGLALNYDRHLDDMMAAYIVVVWPIVVIGVVLAAGAAIVAVILGGSR